MLLQFCILSVFLSTISTGSSRHGWTNVSAPVQVRPLVFLLSPCIPLIHVLCWCIPSYSDPYRRGQFFVSEVIDKLWKILTVSATTKFSIWITNSYVLVFMAVAICFLSLTVWIHVNSGNMTSLPFGTCSVILQPPRNKYLSFAAAMEFCRFS